MTDSRTRRKIEPDFKRSPGEVRKWESRQLGRACSAEFCCSVLFSQGPETFSWECIVKCSDCGLFENLTTRTCLYVSSRGIKSARGDRIRGFDPPVFPLADSIRWDQIRGGIKSAMTPALNTFWNAKCNNYTTVTRIQVLVRTQPLFFCVYWRNSRWISASSSI